jgi:hypothetical protein
MHRAIETDPHQTYSFPRSYFLSTQTQTYLRPDTFNLDFDLPTSNINHPNSTTTISEDETVVWGGRRKSFPRSWRWIGRGWGNYEVDGRVCFDLSFQLDGHKASEGTRRGRGIGQRRCRILKVYANRGAGCFAKFDKGRSFNCARPL